MTAARRILPPGHPLRRAASILVAENHEPTFEVIRLICEMEGFGVLRAMTTRAALALARVGQPDLILMDAILADGTSTRAVRAIRGDPATRRIPICPIRGIGARRAPRGREIDRPVNPADLLGLLRGRFSGPSRPRARRGRAGILPPPR